MNSGSHSASLYFIPILDEIDIYALNLTLMHWGAAAWSVYLVVSLTMGLATFRFSLPLTFRSCFYPIIGEYAWGWIGDVLDGFTIVVTVSGVCTRYVQQRNVAFFPCHVTVNHANANANTNSM